jgi:NAD-dependent SIR2 family protein deacetylase
MFARGNADYIAAKYTLLVYEIHESYHNLRIPWDMIPRCPKCDAPMEVNKRKAEVGMVEDADFQAQLQRYNTIISQGIRMSCCAMTISRIKSSLRYVCAWQC